MKPITLILLLAIMMATTSYAQHWTDNLPKDKLENSTLTLNDYKKAFDDYWAPYNVEGGYYLNQDGEKTKAPGWKIFKRWVWKMENYVDGEGNLPSTTTVEELKKYFKEYPESTKSVSGDWSNIGYNQTPGGYQGVGRVNTISFHPSDANTFWIGTPSGGMWKTSDGGSSWTVLTDQLAVLGVSAIAIPTDYATSNTIYIGTGDRDGNSTGSMGAGTSHDCEGIGVMKSTDGGATWNTTGLSFATSQKVVINDLLIHPTNNQIIYAAASNGLYKTIDGGANWTTLTSYYYFQDIEFNPGNPSIMYGADEGFGYAQVIGRSTDGGATWSQITLPGSTSYRTEIAVSANNSSVVYALTVNSTEGMEGLYKSTDSGATFSLIYSVGGGGYNLLGYDCTDTGNDGQGTYDIVLTANPADANEVYAGGINIWKTTNGGTAWSIKSHWSGTCSGTATTVHADQHCCEFNGSTVYFGNDGGIYKSSDAGSTITDLSNGLTINQIYRIGLSQNTSNEAIVGLQDNGTHHLSGGNWVANAVIGGDGMECLIDPTTDQIQFGEYHSGDISRTSNHWSSKTNVRSFIRTASGNANLKGAWVTPYLLDPNNRMNLFVGYHDIWKSTDQGTTSTNFSQIVVNSYSGSDYIRALQIAPSNSNYIYASYYTSLHKSINAGGTWTDITGSLPVAKGNIVSITVKNDDPNTVWVTLGGFDVSGANDAVYQTTNGGSSWTNISAGLPFTPAMSIVQNVQNTTNVELYVAMSGGVWMKHGTSNWVSFNTNLPAVFCSELEIYYDNTTTSNSRLRVGTFGRGLWESDLRGPPVAEFSADNLLPANSMTTVNFMDESIGSPSSWSWSFSPATVTYIGGTNSTSQNPSVRFNSMGSYTVTLQATNGLGSDSEVKTDYIHVGTPGKWLGTTDATWSTTTNWENHIVPDATTQVSITGAAYTWPTFTGNFTIGTDCGLLSMAPGAEFTVTGDFTIASGKTFTCNGATTLYVGGDWENNGTFTPGSGTVEFYGSNNSNINSNNVYLINETFNTWPGSWLGDIGTSYGSFSQQNSNNSGGVQSPEARFLWQNFTGTKRLYYGPINTSGLSSITLDFQHFLDDYDGSQGYTIEVQSSTDATSWSNASWSVSPTGNVGPSSVSVSLSATHGVGSPTLYIAFSITGFLQNLDFWYIDDVKLYYPANQTFYNLTVNKTSAEITTTSNVNANNLNVRPKAFLTNNSGSILNIGNQFILEADNTGAASFIDEGTTTVTNGTFIQYYCESDFWHYISACFDPAGQTFDLLFPASPGPVPTAFYRWDESHTEQGSTGWWIDILNSGEWGTNTFIAGQGFAISDYTKGTTYSLSGTLNNGQQILSPSMTKTTGSSAEGYNLVGNPFPCSMAANSNADANNNFITKNSGVLDATKNGIYLYDETYGDYRTVSNATAAAYIARGQGFMVKAKDNTGLKVSFNAADRKHGAATFYKGGDATQRFFLTVSNPENAINETEIVFMEGMTNGLDISYDAGKMKGNSQLALYSYLVENNNEEFAVQALPLLTEPVIVPVGLNAAVQGKYTFTAEMLNFDPGTPVTLEDKYTNVQTDLSINPQYDFVVETPGTFDNRFLLHFKSAVDIEENYKTIDPFEIYTIGSKVIVSSVENTPYKLSVFNSTGQLIVQKDFTGNANEEISITTLGAYIVRLVSENGVVTKKIIIN